MRNEQKYGVKYYMSHKLLSQEEVKVTKRLLNVTGLFPPFAMHSIQNRINNLFYGQFPMPVFIVDTY